MALLIELLYVFSAINIVLLLSLAYVWGRNFLRFRSKHTLGLLVFCVLLLVENATAFYLFGFDPTMSHWINNPNAVPLPAQRTLTGLRVLELAGIAFLSWVTWD